jgi:hypothetical protein
LGSFRGEDPFRKEDPYAVVDLRCEPSQDAGPVFTVYAASLTGSRRLWVAQKYHFFRKASEKTKKKGGIP